MFLEKNSCTRASFFNHFQIGNNIRIYVRRDGIVIHFGNIFFLKLLLNNFDQAGNFIRDKQMVVPRQRVITINKSVFSREYAEMKALLLRAFVQPVYPATHISSDCGEQPCVAHFVCRTVCTDGFQIF